MSKKNKDVTENSGNTITVTDVINEYNSILDESKKLNYFVRATELQSKQAEILEKFKNRIKSYKYQAIEHNDETHANLFFHFQCVLNSYISILKMWVALKDHEFESAWALLIDSQEYVYVALRASENHFGIDTYLDHLTKIENTIFPGWNVYNSVGAIETAGRCSICGEEYGKCDHLEDFIYMGRLCRRIERRQVEFNHTAMVEHPRDRRCIIKAISTDDGYMRDYLTWRISDKKVEIPEGSIAVMEGIVHCFSNRDFD